MTWQARAYVSSISMLILLLLAVHFSLQVKTQKTARAWVTAWAKQHGVRVDHAHWRMLHGVLTLNGVHVQHARADMDVTTVVLHGALLEGKMQIRQVEVSGVRWRWHGKPEVTYSALHQWQAWLAQFPAFAHLQKLALRKVYMSGQKADTGMWLSADWDALAQSWHAQGSDDRGGSWQLDAKAGQGAIQWSSLHDQVLANLLNVPSAAGQWTGHASWSQQALKGEAHWLGDEGKKGALSWQGERDGQQWKVQWYAHALPLHSWLADWPVILGQVWQSAYVTGHGVAIWQDGLMRAQADELRLDDVVLQHGGQISMRIPHMTCSLVQWKAGDSPWHIQHASLQGGSWLLPGTTLHMDDIQGDIDWSNQQWFARLTANMEQQGQGQWQLELEQKSGEQEVTMRWHVQDAPLRLFRTWLPPGLQQQARIQGALSFQWAGTWTAKHWQLQGNAWVKHVVWEAASELWQAEDVILQQFAMASGEPLQVQEVDVSGWQVLLPMQPWRGYSQTVKSQPLQSWDMGNWRVQRLEVGDGQVSLGNMQTVWFVGDEMYFSPLIPGKAVQVYAHGQLADGDFRWQGTWFPWGEHPWFSTDVQWRDALPFVARTWLQLSSLPVWVQGRISADLHIRRQAEQARGYQGALDLKVQHVRLQQTVVSNPEFEAWAGYSPEAFWTRLAPQGNVHTHLDLDDLSLPHGLDMRVLGQQVIHDWLRQLKQVPTAQRLNHMPKYHTEVAIRLHDGDRDSLKHNERVRLRKILHALQRHRQWYVVLKPMLGQAPLTDTLQQRIRQTQQKIEVFLRQRGIAVSRILPRLPEEMHRSGDMLGIQVQLVSSGK